MANTHEAVQTLMKTITCTVVLLVTTTPSLLAGRDEKSSNQPTRTEAARFKSQGAARKTVRKRSVDKPASRPPAESTKAPAQRPTLEEAKRVIPGTLNSIYHALDQGNPQAVRSLLSDEVANSFEKLDRICKPFNYRAHYIEAIIERPLLMFEVRTHVLLNPVDEYIYVLVFSVRQDHYYLKDITDPADNWLESKNKIAEDVTRKFIDAAKASRLDVLKQLVSPGLNISLFVTDPCWKIFFEHINQISYSTSIKSNKGLKLEVHLDLGNCFGAWGTFVVDQIDGEFRIVAAHPFDFGMCFFEFEGCRETFPDKVDDQNLEEYTLKRFGLITSGSRS